MLVTHRQQLDELAARLEAEETLEDEGLQQALAPLYAVLGPDTTSGDSPTSALPRQRRAAKASPVKASPVEAEPVKASPAKRAPRSAAVAEAAAPVARPTRKRT